MIVMNTKGIRVLRNERGEGYRMARPISDRPGCISHLYKHLILHIIVYESIIIKGLVIEYMM